MAALLAGLLSVLLCSAASAPDADAEKALSPRRDPHLTGCVSTNMETFRCRWNVGTFQNLSKPGDLRLFYISKKPPPASPSDWSECPHYSAERPNECFFNENHTSVWTYYSVQLRSRDQAVLYDEILFHVQDIVQPDPPVSLNWTLLNISVTGNFYDILLSWKPPLSADVETGWMRLWYQVQHRQVNSDHWEVTDLVKSTHRSLYGLQTGVNHEIRVRCKVPSAKEFGEFGSSVFVDVAPKGSRFPVVALLIFGALCLVAILMLVIISQQEKLMVILLPPVPGPKIRGIDPNLLKKGKLRELTSILGSPPDLRPELYNSDPWVEFIDVDMEEPSDQLTDRDTDCLVDPSPLSNCSPLSVGFQDDDSGRASCCDPDLSSDPEASPFHLVIADKFHGEEASCSTTSIITSAAPIADVAASVRDTLYTQVSEVRESGKVLLSPEDRDGAEDGAGGDTERIIKPEREDKKEFQLLAVTGDHGGYASEMAGKRSQSSAPVFFPGDSQGSPLPPAPVYTMVDGVDRQNSILLTPNSTPVLQLTISKAAAAPDGYLTPDLLGSITP